MLRKTLYGCSEGGLRYYFNISLSKARMINFQKYTKLPISSLVHFWITCVKNYNDMPKLSKDMHVQLQNCLLDFR